MRVLGRVLFGVSILFLGLLVFFDLSSYAGYAPSYLPVPLILALGVGAILTFAGFAIFANLHTERAALSIALVFISFILIVNLPTGNMLELAQNLAFVGAALLIATQAKEELHSSKPE